MKKFYMGGLVIAVISLLAVSTSMATHANAEREENSSAIQTNDESDPRAGVSQEEIDRDRKLNPTFDLLSALPGFQDGGLDSKGERIFVYWKGDVGAEAEQIADESAARGVPVDFISVDYSYEELRAIAGKVVRTLEADGVELEGYTIGKPFEEITLLSDDLAQSPQLQGRAMAAVDTILPKGLRLGFEEAMTAHGVDSRHDDGGQPTPGNAFRVTSISGYPKCTSGLGWENPGTIFYMLTAAHCVNFANNHSVAFYGNPYNAGTYSGYIGTLVGSGTLGGSGRQLDATLVGVPAAASIPGEIFMGTANTTSKVDVPLIGVIPINTLLCSSGSATGSHCRIKRDQEGYSRVKLYSDSTTYRYVDVVTVRSIDGTLIFGSGDSGGPLVRSSDYKAVGIITGIPSGHEYNCGSANWWGANTLCTKSLGFVTQMAQINAELEAAKPELRPRLRP